MATNSMPTQVRDDLSPESQYGEVFDRGYAHYDGPRRGRRGAITSLIGYSMKRAMGIRKSWTAKILPFLLYVSASIPLIVMLGIAAIVPQLEFASYTGYFSGIFVLLGLFVAICAPEMVCVDRQERTLPLYFSRAISRGDYAFAKIIAMALLTMTMTAVPGVLLWLGRQLTADGVWKNMRENVDDLLKVILFSIIVSLTLGTVGLMVSSFTNRKGVAITIILIGFLVMTGLAQSLYVGLEDHEWAKWFLLGDLGTVVTLLSDHLFDDLGMNRTQFVEALDLTQTQAILYLLALTLFAALIFRLRYRPRDDA